MDFAPYQSASPDTSRRSLNIPRSPPPTSPTPRSPAPVLPTHAPGGGWRSSFGAERESVNQYETSLPIRLDWEAVMAYVLLPPAAGVFLLMVETKSDYVRFHAWQSALLFSFAVVVHLVFSFSKVLSYLLLVGDLVAIAYLAMRAYKDADTLDRCEVPFFGPLASSILDDE